MAPKRLLVDGYNVLHGWGWMKPGGEAIARQRLVDELRILADAEGFEIRVVFDGAGRRPSRDAGASTTGVEVVFASRGRTADGFIEGEVASAGASADYTVVTADGAERETVLALGAQCLSPNELRSWIDRCEKRASRTVTRDRRQNPFGNRLPL